MKFKKPKPRNFQQFVMLKYKFEAAELTFKEDPTDQNYKQYEKARKEFQAYVDSSC